MSKKGLPRAYVNAVVQAHYADKLTYQQIVDKLADRWPATLASVKKVLTKWRKRNSVNSYRTVAKEINEQLISHYESTDCKIRNKDLVVWANEHLPRADDQPWTMARVNSVLSDWRLRTGRLNKHQLRQIGTWNRIHELLTTGYTAADVAVIFNSEQYQFSNGQPWTTEAVKQFHHKHSQKYNIDLASTAYRSEEECLEISFLCSMWRVDGYSADEMVDRFNERTELRRYWYHGRPFTRSMVNNIMFRSRSILRELENKDMSAVVETMDRRVATAAGVRAVEDIKDEVELRIVSADSNQEPESKVERLRRVAYRVLELKDDGARNEEIQEVLSSEFARDGGWDRDAIAAVEQYGRRYVDYIPRQRDPTIMSALGERIHLMRGRLTHAQIAAELNSESLSNEVSPGQQWSVAHVRKVLDFRRNQAKKISGKTKQQDEQNVVDRTTGRRMMRKSDIAIREMARERLKMKDAAFARAAELHKQMEVLQRQIAEAQHQVDEADMAAQLLMETGAPRLLEQLSREKASSDLNSKDHEENADRLEAQKRRIDQLTKRIVSEDWR